MKLPVELLNTQVWTVMGPLGPRLPDFLSNNTILCVDGGANFTDKMDVWVGDGDSSKNVIDCPHIFKFSPRKNQSDLTLALNLLTQALPRTLHLWGFVGGRKDHELLNLGEVMHFLDALDNTEVIFYDVESNPVYHAFSTGDWIFAHTGTFSVTSIKAIKIKILGSVSYPITEVTELAALSSLGLSNIASGEVQIINQGPVMVIFPGTN